MIRTPCSVRSILGVLLLALAATGCNDQGGGKPTAPVASRPATGSSGTRIDPNASTLRPHYSLSPALSSNAGPAVGVLSYCTDITGSLGAENVARALLADGRFGSVTIVDGSTSQPTAQDLLSSYAAVIAMTDNRCGQPIPQNIADAAANALAGFAQGGGGVVLTTFGFSDRTTGGIGFGASIFADGLSPFQPGAPGNADAGAIDVAGASTGTACQALLDGVTSPLSSTYANYVSLSRGATWCASYSNGLALLAINAAGNIVGLNSFPASEADLGQPAYARLVSNTVFAVSHVSATVEVIPAGSEATVTLTVNGAPIAGIAIPEGTFTEDVTLSAHLVSTTQSAPCHAYLLGQVGQCLQLTALTADGSKAINQQPMTAALCTRTDVGALELFKFEDPQATPFALKQTMAPFLKCTGVQTGSAAPDRSLKGLAMGVAKQIGSWLSPTPLYAAHGGFGGQILISDGLSYFTWASPIQISKAGLAANVLNSGKDAFVAAGTFNVSALGLDGETGFNPSTQAITVAIRKSVSTIPAGAFKYSPPLKAWVYAARTQTGITAMSISAATGSFTVAATLPTGGPLPTNTPFSLQIGHRTQGLLLLCGATGVCIPQEPE